MAMDNPILRDLKRKHDLDLLLELAEVEKLPPGLEKDFRHLAITCKSETALLSQIEGKARHPAYRQIVAMGQRVVPFILRELQRDPGHWFRALREITGEDPVPEEHAGDIQAMADDWVNWGKKKGLI
jgi:hypothetical protein